MRAAAALITALLLHAGQAGAASPPPPVPLPPVVPAPAPSEPVVPPYQERIERLAELLGILAFMHDLCGGDGGPDWRGEMSALVESEGATEQRRERLAGAYNRGYASYRLIYRVCTPAAQTVVARSLAEGEQLATSLSRLFPAE